MQPPGIDSGMGECFCVFNHSRNAKSGSTFQLYLHHAERARLGLLDSSEEIAAQMSWKTANPSDLAESVTMRTADISIVMACSGSHLLHPFD